MIPNDEVEHCYGDNVHILSDPLSSTLLAKLCSPGTFQPAINRLVANLYRQLVYTVVASEIARQSASVPTRMYQSNPEAIWRGDIVDPSAKVTVVCVARAGIFPSQVCYDFLNEILDPSCVRQDHMLMNRTTDDAGQVSGAAIHGAKIGGSVEGATLFIPDPMGATGSTVETLLNYYRDHVPGNAKSVIALNLIITPEYIRRLRDRANEVQIYAFRLDRGLSSKEVLASRAGEFWDQERGLNDHGYIIPGGGGFGEIMNNAFV